MSEIDCFIPPSSPSSRTALPAAQKEIDRLRRLVYELSWDEPFGMLTRNAFLQHCRGLKSGVYDLIFIDLDDIGELNLMLGYQEVDRRVHDAFSVLDGGEYLVARWYSGDEIIILVKPGLNLQMGVQALTSATRRLGLTFVFAGGRWDASCQPIELAVRALSLQASRQKLERVLNSES